MTLDAGLIRRRRGELGLSQRALGRRLGVSSLTVGRIESGDNGEELTLRMLGRLAEALALDPRDLIADTPAPAPAAPSAALSSVGSLLAAADGPVAEATLTDALGITAADTDRLLAELDAALRPVGLRLHRHERHASIVSSAADRDVDALERLLRGQHATAGLSATDASMLFRAYTGTVDPVRLGNAEQVALARLNNAGLVDADLTVTDDVRFGLDLS